MFKAKCFHAVPLPHFLQPFPFGVVDPSIPGGAAFFNPVAGFIALKALFFGACKLPVFETSFNTMAAYTITCRLRGGRNYKKAEYRPEYE